MACLFITVEAPGVPVHLSVVEEAAVVIFANVISITPPHGKTAHKPGITHRVRVVCVAARPDPDRPQQR